MARIRTIKPEFWTSESVVECSCSARLLLIGMLNFADDYGNLVNSPKRLKMQIFPADNIDVSPLLDELVVNGLVIPYVVDGEKYLNIKGFRKHQVINKPSKSKIPLPSFDNTIDVVVSEECSTTTVVVSEECLTEGNGREGNGLNNNKNVGEEKTKGNLYVVPSRRMFPITQDWKPEPETWAATLKVSQHLVKPDQFTDYTLAEFIRSNVGKDEKTENDWQRFYVNAVARGYVKPIAQNQQPTQQPTQSKQRQQPQYDEYITPPLYVKPPPEVVNRASPERIKEIMDDMRRKIAGGE